MSSALVFGWLSPLISWILATGFLVTWWRWSPSRYVLAVSAAYFFMGCGFVLSHVTSHWSALPHFVPTQIMYFTALIAMASAFCMRVNKRPPMRTMIIVSIVAIGVSAFFQNTGAFASERLAVTNLGQGLVVALAAWTIRPSHGAPINTDKRLYWVVVLTAAQFLIRPALCYAIEGGIGPEEFRASLYWAILNATVIAFSLLMAISLALAIASDIIDEMASEKSSSAINPSNRHPQAFDSILTKDELEMLTKP